MFNNSTAAGQTVDQMRDEVNKQIKNVGEKFHAMVTNGTLQRGVKNAAYKTTLGLGAIGGAGLISSAISTGSVGVVMGLTGLEALLHKAWEKFATRYSHNNTILFVLEELVLIEKTLQEKGRSLKDLELNEVRVLHDMVAPIAEEAQRKKIDRYK